MPVNVLIVDGVNLCAIIEEYKVRFDPSKLFKDLELAFRVVFTTKYFYCAYDKHSDVPLFYKNLSLPGAISMPEYSVKNYGVSKQMITTSTPSSGNYPNTIYEQALVMKLNECLSGLGDDVAADNIIIISSNFHLLQLIKSVNINNVIKVVSTRSLNDSLRNGIPCLEDLILPSSCDERKQSDGDNKRKFRSTVEEGHSVDGSIAQKRKSYEDSVVPYAEDDIVWSDLRVTVSGSQYRDINSEYDFVGIRDRVGYYRNRHFKQYIIYKISHQNEWILTDVTDHTPLSQGVKLYHTQSPLFQIWFNKPWFSAQRYQQEDSIWVDWRNKHSNQNNHNYAPPRGIDSGDSGKVQKDKHSSQSVRTEQQNLISFLKFQRKTQENLNIRSRVDNSHANSLANTHLEVTNAGIVQCNGVYTFCGLMNGKGIFRQTVSLKFNNRPGYYMIYCCKINANKSFYWFLSYVPNDAVLGSSDNSNLYYRVCERVDRVPIDNWYCMTKDHQSDCNMTVSVHAQDQQGGSIMKPAESRQVVSVPVLPSPIKPTSSSSSLLSLGALSSARPSKLRPTSIPNKETVSVGTVSNNDYAQCESKDIAECDLMTTKQLGHEDRVTMNTCGSAGMLSNVSTMTVSVEQNQHEFMEVQQVSPEGSCEHNLQESSAIDTSVIPRVLEYRRFIEYVRSIRTDPFYADANKFTAAIGSHESFEGTSLLVLKAPLNCVPEVAGRYEFRGYVNGAPYFEQLKQGTKLVLWLCKLSKEKLWLISVVHGDHSRPGNIDDTDLYFSKPSDSLLPTRSWRSLVDDGRDASKMTVMHFPKPSSNYSNTNSSSSATSSEGMSQEESIDIRILNVLESVASSVAETNRRELSQKAFRSTPPHSVHETLSINASLPQCVQSAHSSVPSAASAAETSDKGTKVAVDPRRRPDTLDREPQIECEESLSAHNSVVHSRSPTQMTADNDKNLLHRDKQSVENRVPDKHIPPLASTRGGTLSQVDVDKWKRTVTFLERNRREQHDPAGYNKINFKHSDRNLRGTVITVTGAAHPGVDGEYRYIGLMNQAGVFTKLHNDCKFAIYRYEIAINRSYSWFLSMTPERMNPGTSRDTNLYFCQNHRVNSAIPEDVFKSLTNIQTDNKISYTVHNSHSEVVRGRDSVEDTGREAIVQGREGRESQQKSQQDSRSVVHTKQSDKTHQPQKDSGTVNVNPVSTGSQNDVPVEEGPSDVQLTTNAMATVIRRILPRNAGLEKGIQEVYDAFVERMGMDMNTVLILTNIVCRFFQRLIVLRSQTDISTVELRNAEVSSELDHFDVAAKKILRSVFNSLSIESIESELLITQTEIEVETQGALSLSNGEAIIPICVFCELIVEGK